MASFSSENRTPGLRRLLERFDVTLLGRVWTSGVMQGDPIDPVRLANNTVLYSSGSEQTMTFRLRGTTSELLHA